MATTSATLSSIFLTMNPNPSFSSRNFFNSSLVLVSSPPASATAALASKRTTVPFRDLVLKNPSNSDHRRSRFWRIEAEATDEAITVPLETAQEIMAAKGDGVATIISTLLFVGFVGLSILTIGVIYIGVTDFLQNREKEKFVKEEAARSKEMKMKMNTEKMEMNTKKKKNSGKKIRVRATSKRGPREKEQEDDDDI